MKKIFYSAVLFAVCSSEAMAGGLVTNSNQSASFLRNPARDAVIDIDGVYTNPAGVCFMSNGFHLGLTGQHPEQQRIATTTFQHLALNQNYLGEATRTYKGQASAPIVPSFQAAYVMDKWTVSASFAVGGGGGKCTFDKGIGSLECLVATMPSQLAKQNNMPIGTYTYTLDSYMKGRQYYFGFQVGAGYKINENLSVFGGLRTVFGNASYTGYVKNIKYTSVDQTATAPYTAAIINGINAQVADMEMTTDQSCVGYTPVISVDYRLNDQWNFAAKYEFRTKMNLENSSEMNEAAREQKALDKFNDKVNKYVRDDIPGTLTLGVQYSPIETVRLNAGYHFYDDCNAKKADKKLINADGTEEYVAENKLINHGTREFLFGAEWDATKLLTVSAGWQNTHYDISDAYMSDMVHNLSSNMIVCGVRLHVTEKFSVDLGYMHNFYDKRTVETTVKGVPKKDVYERKNDAFAVGVNFDI
jgi:long-chain fatty acid transport protein